MLREDLQNTKTSPTLAATGEEGKDAVRASDAVDDRARHDPDGTAADVRNDGSNEPSLVDGFQKLSTADTAADDRPSAKAPPR